MTPARRIRLLLEMGALYVVTPFLVLVLVHWAGVSLIVALVPVLLAVILALSLDSGFSWTHLLRKGISPGQLAGILALFAALGSALTLFVWICLPESFLSFPRHRPGLWIAVMMFYPLVSVTAQEIAYRVLFVHRYGVLFGERIALGIATNAALFAFGHIYFGSWITVAVSFAGGLIFAWRYWTARSFWAVMLEHSLYGMLIFTIGLGRYFFTGVPLG